MESLSADAIVSSIGTFVQLGACVLVTALVLGLLSLGLFQLNANGLSTADTFTTKQPSVTGEEAPAEGADAASGPAA